MLTQDDLQRIGELFDKKMDEKLEPVTKALEQLDKKLDQAQEDISAILTHLGHEHAKLDKCVDRIEKRLDLPPLEQ